MGFFKTPATKTLFEDLLHDHEDRQAERQRNVASRKSRGARDPKRGHASGLGTMCTRDFHQIREALKR